MAGGAAYLYESVAKDYVNVRPRYPPRLFSLLSSLTPRHQLAWDVGTGNGQAALQISKYYERVIATDISEQQLQHAETRPNISYALTPPVLTDDALHSIVGPEGSVDLVTVAMAVHWFDLNTFYTQVKRVLRKPGGVFAVWAYTKPSVSPAVDEVFGRFFERVLPFFEPCARWVFVEEYRTLPFPFSPHPAAGEKPVVELEIEETRTLEEYLTCFRTWSALVDSEYLLSDNFVRQFEEAWGGPSYLARTVKLPLFLKVGMV